MKKQRKITEKVKTRLSSLKVNQRLSDAGIPHNGQSINRVSATKFFKAIQAGKKQNKNSWMVDVHSVKEYQSMKCYLTADGKAGIAIKKDGDVVSVFSSGGNKSLGKLLPFAVANGGRKLDCFGKGLQDMYARYGAKATGQTPFSEEAAPDDWDKKDKPPVVAMTLPDSLDELIKSYNPNAKIDMGSVRVFDNYKKMINDRDKALLRRGAQNTALGLVAK